MTDLRKTVASYFFRAQFGQQTQQRRPQPQRLAYSGPSDTPDHDVATRAAESGRQAGGARVDDLGMSARAAGGAAAGAGLPGAAGPDPRQLATNRGEQQQQKQEPVTVEDEPGRNDPCPCGSGKKYKKCHGRG